MSLLPSTVMVVPADAAGSQSSLRKASNVESSPMTSCHTLASSVPCRPSKLNRLNNLKSFLVYQKNLPFYLSKFLLMRTDKIKCSKSLILRPTFENRLILIRSM